MEMVKTIVNTSQTEPTNPAEMSEVTSDFFELNKLGDTDLLSSTKTAVEIYKGAGQHVYAHLKELKARYDECKTARKPFLGYKNFDLLCDEKLNLTSRQVRNILNGDPTGKKHSHTKDKTPKRLPPVPKTERDKHFFNAGCESQERIDPAKPEKTLYLHSSAEELKHAAEVARNSAEAEMQMRHEMEIEDLNCECEMRLVETREAVRVETVQNLGIPVIKVKKDGKLVPKDPAEYTAADLVKTAIGFIDWLTESASKHDKDIFLRSLTQVLGDRIDKEKRVVDTAAKKASSRNRKALYNRFKRYCKKVDKCTLTRNERDELLAWLNAEQARFTEDRTWQNDVENMRVRAKSQIESLTSAKA